MYSNGSVQENPYLKIMNYQCRTLGCGGSYRYHLEFVRTVTPAGCEPSHNVFHPQLKYAPMNPTPPKVLKGKPT